MTFPQLSRSAAMTIIATGLIFLQAFSIALAAAPIAHGADSAAVQQKGAPAICIGHKSTSHGKGVVSGHVHNATVFFVGNTPSAQSVTATCATAVDMILHNLAGAFSPLPSLPVKLPTDIQPIEITPNRNAKKQAVLRTVSDYISQLYPEQPEPSSTLRAAILVSEKDNSVIYLLHQFQPESNQINFYYHSAAPGGAVALKASRRSLAVVKATCPNGFCKVLPKLPPGCVPKSKSYPACTKSCICK